MGYPKIIDKPEFETENQAIESVTDVKKLEEEKKSSFEAMSVEEHVQMYVDQGMSKKDAIKQAAVDRGVPKRDVYNAVMK